MESKFRRVLLVGLGSFCVLWQTKKIDAQQVPAALEIGPSYQQVDANLPVPVVQSFGDSQPRSPNQIQLDSQTQSGHLNSQSINQAVTAPPNQDPRGSAIAHPRYTPSDMMIRASVNSPPDKTTSSAANLRAADMSQMPAGLPEPTTRNRQAKSSQPIAHAPHPPRSRRQGPQPGASQFKKSQQGPYVQATHPHVANVVRFQPDSQAPQYAEGAIDPIRALEAKVYSLQCQLDTLGSCDSCFEPEENRPGPGGFYFGAGAIFAKPHLKESFQYSQINLATSRQTLVPFEYDYQSTLRGWVGYRSPEGFGFKVTYWGFDDEGRTSVNTADGMNIYGASAVTVIFPANIFAIAPGQTLTNTDFLKTQIINYYGNYEAKVGSFDVDGSLGLRYARLLQSLDSFVTPAGGGSPIRRLSWERKYDGLGPAISVDVKRQIGCSGFSVVGQGGGALLFGKKTINRVVIGDQSPQPATRVLVLDEADEVVGIGEMNFGVEWSRQFRGGRNLNIRGLYEGQLWAEAGAPTLGFLGFEGFGVQVELTR